MFIIDNNFLSEESRCFIEKNILGHSFPYYYSANTIHNPPDNNPYMSNDIVKRPEERALGETVTSPYANDFLRILKDFVDKNNIEVKEVLRASVNITFAGNTDRCPTHTDHPYPHDQLLVYLNDCLDKEACTVIGDVKISPEKYKGVCFKSAPHYMIFPKKGARVVAVYTFR